METKYEQRERRERHKQAQECVRCSATTAYTSLTLCDRCQGLAHISQRQVRQRLKLQTLEAYGGPRCVCCGENQEIFLTIDHIQTDGKSHRKSLQATGTSFYRKLKQLGFPNEPPLQVLCYNCNRAKYHCGSCPHTSFLESVTPLVAYASTGG